MIRVGVVEGPPMVASISRVFLNEEMRWTLEATCSECLAETSVPLILGEPNECSGCGVTITIDPDKTVFHRRGGAGRIEEPLRRFRWGHGLFRGFPHTLHLPGLKKPTS